MSLHEDIIQLAVEEHGFARLPGNYRALDEIINNVLDAAVEAARSRKRGQDLYSWEFDAAIEEAITEINKLRPES